LVTQGGGPWKRRRSRSRRSEGVDISGLALEQSELGVNIPMFGIIESLNLGTSSGIVLYEITKQRRAFQEKLKARIAAK
jgi:tRNA (guanosine-2'-O-)-methyltransferase